MEYWLTWAIVLGIGLIVALLVHAVVRLAQGSGLLATIVAGLVGAAAAAYIVAPFTATAELPLQQMRFLWAFVGSLVLSLIVEAAFAGTTRGRVLTT